MTRDYFCKIYFPLLGLKKRALLEVQMPIKREAGLTPEQQERLNVTFQHLGYEEGGGRRKTKKSKKGGKKLFKVTKI